MLSLRGVNIRMTWKKSIKLGIVVIFLILALIFELNQVITPDASSLEFISETTALRVSHQDLLHQFLKLNNIYDEAEPELIVDLTKNLDKLQELYGDVNQE